MRPVDDGVVDTIVGAAWMVGEQGPFWMDPAPWYDECAAADAAQDAEIEAARAALLTRLLTERFGDTRAVARESRRPARPHPAAAAAEAARCDDELTCRRRLRMLDDALHEPAALPDRYTA